MTRDEALAALKDRLSGDAPGEHVGPSVEAVARALRAGEGVSTDEIRAALALLTAYVDEVQHLIIGAARGEGDGDKPRLTWWEVGTLLGFPGGTAAQRATVLARKLGLLGPARRRTDEED